MVGRANRPPTLTSTPGLPPQAHVTFSDDHSRVSAALPTGESVSVLLHGATVVSWKDAASNEKLFVSSAAALDGSKPVRGGIPLVFPVFGTDAEKAAALPQHGFARAARWEFLGKSTSESAPEGSVGVVDLSAKLDFGLSAAGLSDGARAAWPFAFNLIYSVTLNRESLTTSLVISNDDDKAFEFQALMHTYLRVKDITQTEITGLDGASYVDKVDGAAVKTQSANITITGETDRVYTPLASGTQVVVVEGGKKTFSVARDNLSNVVVWNPWVEKAKGMGDFEPKDGYKNMLCVEPGAVSGWQTLEPGDAFEGAQTITYYS